MQEPEAVGVVDGLHVFAFNSKDILVKLQTVNGKIELIEPYKWSCPIEGWSSTHS